MRPRTDALCLIPRRHSALEQIRTLLGRATALAASWFEAHSNGTNKAVAWADEGALCLCLTDGRIQAEAYA